jgi:AraC-like DNA-binding protein/mannose-6-phosphate isomerase-like protein (cupin superfamily)
MNQMLIDELWTRTDQNKNEIVVENKNDGAIGAPSLLSADHVFRDAASSLFLSFHHEVSNSMMHYHDFFEMIYVCKGQPVGVINDHELSLEEGSLCIMNPNAVHYFKKYSEATDLILNIVLPKHLFQKSIFRILLNDPVLNAFFIRYRIENAEQPSFLYLPGVDEGIDLLLELLIKEYLNKKEYSRVIIEALLTLIFSYLLRSYRSQSKPGNSLMSDILDYIYLNHRTVTMQSMAKHYNYHPKYLSSFIHKQSGQSFRELIVRIKLQSAANYLQYTNDTIEQIVEMIGYKDKSTFYSMFKKEYGLSPNAFRMQKTKEPED